MSGDLPESGSKLVLDLSEWESNWSSVMGDADTLQSTIDDLSGSVDIDINITGDDALPFDEIPESTSTEVDVTETDDAKQAVADIHFMALKDKIETIWNIAGTAIDFAKNVGGAFVNPFLDVEDAVARINAQTGGTGIEDLGDFIRDIQAADLGDSVEEISNVVIAAKQLNAPIDEATRASLTFVKVFDDQDPVTVMTSLKSLSDQFGVSITEASDLMTVFFQQGGNKGGDALSVVNANAQSWADMGLSLTEALSAIQSLMTGGVDSATDASKMIQTFDDALTAAAADPTSQQAKMLKMMGVDNPKDAGEAIGAETIDGFATAFNNIPADQQDLVSGLFFGKGGKKFTGAIEDLTTQSDMFQNVVDAATNAATEIDNSLRGAIDDFVLEVNTKITELLSSSNIDLPGKIKALKEGLQEAVAVIADGGTIGEALEVGLNIPGLEDTLNTFIGNFERIIGNLEIAFLQIVATIQDITGHGKEAEGTRATIKRLAANQLAFDLQLSNPEEITAQVTQALSRGLSPDEIGASVTTALNESMEKANFDQGVSILQGLIDGAIANGASPEEAKAWADKWAAPFITQLGGNFDNTLSAGNLDLIQKMLAIDPNAKIPGLDEAVAGFQKQLSDAFAPQNRTGESGNPFTSGMFAGQERASATSQGGLFGNIVEDVDNFTDKLTEGSDAAGLSFDHVATTANTMSTDVGTAIDATTEKFNTAAVEAALMDQGITLSLTGNTVTRSFEEVASSAASAFPGVIAWFQQTSAAAAAFDNLVSLHLRSVTKQLADLNFLAQQVIANVTSAQALNGAVGGGGTTNNVTNNVSVTNNVPNGAAAAANSYTLASSLRPGGV